MNKIRRGFTLIEVSLFLAITGVVFVSIAVGTQNSIFQQRYNDSVQNFSEFLRTVYSQVKNVQNNESKGNTDKAIYGKLVTFGEEYNLNGDKNADEMIFTYNVIGKIGNEDGNIIDQLKDLEANVVYETYDALGHTNGYELAGFAESYLPRWGSKIQTTAGWNGTSYDNFEGTLLIVRHPSSGVIYTKVLSHTIQVNDILKNGSTDSKKNLLIDELDNFETEQVDFCVNPNGKEKSTLRRDVRLSKGLRNASGIQIISDEEDWVDVGGTSKNIGNRCE